MKNILAVLLIINLTSHAQIADVDGNTYQTTQIGNQTWMIENLRTTKLNDGTPIENGVDTKIWFNYQSKTPKYSYQIAKGADPKQYGAFYNWYTVSTGKVCPAGWRVPSKVDFQVLISSQGGEAKAGLVLKSNTPDWNDMDEFKGRGNNQSGFNGVPAGFRYYNGNFDSFKTSGTWWSSTAFKEGNEEGGWAMQLVWMTPKAILLADHYDTGFSIRCVKD